MYVMTNRRLEIPLENLRSYSRSQESGGKDPPRLVFESFGRVMNAVGLPNNHRSIYDGKSSPRSNTIAGKGLSLLNRRGEPSLDDPTPAEAYAPSWLPKRWSHTELRSILASTAGPVGLVRPHSGSRKEFSTELDLVELLKETLVLSAAPSGAPAPVPIDYCLPCGLGIDPIFSEENMWIPGIKGPFWTQIFGEPQHDNPKPPPIVPLRIPYTASSASSSLCKAAPRGTPQLLRVVISGRLKHLFGPPLIAYKRKWISKEDSPSPDSPLSPTAYREKRRLSDNRSFGAREREAGALDVLRHHLLFNMQNPEHERAGLRERKKWVRGFMREKRKAIASVIRVYEEERSKAILEELVEDEVEVV